MVKKGRATISLVLPMSVELYLWWCS